MTKQTYETIIAFKIKSNKFTEKTINMSTTIAKFFKKIKPNIFKRSKTVDPVVLEAVQDFNNDGIESCLTKEPSDEYLDNEIQ